MSRLPGNKMVEFRHGLWCHSPLQRCIRSCQLEPLKVVGMVVGDEFGNEIAVGL